MDREVIYDLTSELYKSNLSKSDEVDDLNALD
jgi:hypothetical protein